MKRTTVLDGFLSDVSLSGRWRIQSQEQDGFPDVSLRDLVPPQTLPSNEHLDSARWVEGRWRITVEFEAGRTATPIDPPQVLDE